MQVEAGRAPGSSGSPTDLASDPRSIMVRWEAGCGGQYAFPQDSLGRRILIQGSFYPKEISEEDAQHLESEAGGKPIPRRTWEMNASGVLVISE